MNADGTERVRIKLTSEVVSIMAVFTKVTGVAPKDCVSQDAAGTAGSVLLIIVPEGSGARAIGKGASNVHRLEQILKRKIKIVEYSPNLQAFIENLVRPFRIHRVEEEGGVVMITPQDYQTRGLIIGRNASSLRMFESVVKRYFPIKELRVAQA